MDQQLLFLINRSWTNPFLDRVMATASSFDLWWPVLLGAAVAVAVWGGVRGRAFLLAAGLAVGVTDALVVNTLKDLVGRPRPHEALVGVRTLDLARAFPRVLALGKPLKEEISALRIRRSGGKSFPSGHAANNFAVAAVAAVFFRRWGWLVFIPASVVAYSRIYVGAHWPLDAALSALLGAGLGLLTAVAVEAAWRRWGGNLLPALHRRHPSLLAA